MRISPFVPRIADRDEGFVIPSIRSIGMHGRERLTPFRLRRRERSLEARAHEGITTDERSIPHVGQRLPAGSKAGSMRFHSLGADSLINGTCL